MNLQNVKLPWVSSTFSVNKARVGGWVLSAMIAVPVFTTPAAAAHKEALTVAQLSQRAAALKAAHKSDGDIASKIAAVELTEQLTPAALDHLETNLQLGPKTAQELYLLSDLSATLDPPPDELPAAEPPDAVGREHILRKAYEFAAITMHRMPDFFAIRTTRSFDDRPLIASNTGWTPAHTDLHLAGNFVQQITYRDGHEVSDTDGAGISAPKEGEASPSGLTTTGEFGPILALVLTDSLNGTITWNHWEQTSAGLAAVFHFRVPVDASHYSVGFCWLLQPLANSWRHTNDMANVRTDCYKGKPAYHGSLTIDPATGSVMRIAIESDLPPEDPMERAAIAVQYGSVEIGGRSYMCPVRSVAVSLVQIPKLIPARTILRVNEAVFTGYHRFGSTVRILPAR